MEAGRRSADRRHAYRGKFFPGARDLNRVPAHWNLPRACDLRVKSRGARAGNVLGATPVPGKRYRCKRHHHSVDGRVCPADRRWRSGVAGHADARAVSRRKTALPAEINPQYHRRGGAGSADCRSHGAARSQLPAQLLVRADHRWRRRSAARPHDAARISCVEEPGRDDLRRGTRTLAGAIPA